jgi:large subunit ribosomal protein L6
MSRVGKKAVVLPAGVTAKVEGQNIAVKGAKGELRFEVPGDVNISFADNQIKVDPRNETKRARALWGMTRAQVNNLVVGVTKGFERKLEINGVGYKAEIKGQKITLSLGYSHPIDYTLPEGISAKTDKNLLILSGIDRQLLGAASAKIRSFRPPEPYKGKGIKYVTETILRKAGKTAGK